MAKKVPVPKPRNSGTMTEFGFWNMIRLTLRRKSLSWKPRINTLLKSRRPSQSTNPRLKWEYQCNDCKEWFPCTKVHVDHLTDVGSIGNSEDLYAYINRLFCEEEGLQVLCIKCHDKKTHKLKEYEDSIN